MREMLFRGKRVDNGEWAYGSLITETNPFDKNRVMTHIYDNGFNEILVDPRTIGQYTGVKDLPGTWIFEADIVKVYDVYCNETVVGVVEFCDGSFRIYDTDFTSYDRWMYYKVEVIGNAYDNQELLEEDKT